MRRAVAIVSLVFTVGVSAACQDDPGSPSVEASRTTSAEPAGTTSGTGVLDDTGTCLIGTWQVDPAGNEQLMEAVFAQTLGGVDFTSSGDSTVTFKVDGTFSAAADMTVSASVDVGTGPMDVTSRSTSAQSGTWTTAGDILTAVVLQDDNQTVTTVNGQPSESVSAPGPLSSGAVPVSCTTDTARIEIEIPEAAAQYVPDGYEVVLHRS